jgi:hypothetical protein
MGYFNTQQLPITFTARGMTFTPNVGFALGDSLSTYIDLYGYARVGIMFPAEIDGTVMSFAGGSTSDGAESQPIVVDGEEYTIPIVAGKAAVLDERIVGPWRYLFLRTGTSDNPTVQTALRLFPVCLKA